MIDAKPALPIQPRLLIENCSPDRSVGALRDILSNANVLFDRGAPVRLVFDQTQNGTVAHIMTPNSLVMMAHSVCRPYIIGNQDGNPVEKDARLPRPFATMYLDWRGEWRLPPLNGISSAPLLRGDGSIYSGQGYDPTSGMWLENVPDLTAAIPDRPTRDDAARSLLLIRETFKTFCFADSHMVTDAASGIAMVDTSLAPARDESAFLAALSTAVCRPSLHLAPGVLMRAASMSGAGSGKGLLARCICIVAYGREPYAVTSGSTPEELEKRIAAELIQGGPALFLDNLNRMALKSDLLASAITERPARVRLLGRSQMVPLNAAAFVVLTGNGLTVSEDLARRFILVEFDSGTEDPEARPFTVDIRAEVTSRRIELLSAALTIWRWGRLATGIEAGRTLGSFDQWGKWVRDPLLALGCKDPADRVSEAKARDTRRQIITELFLIWWEKHNDVAMAANDLHEDVKKVIDPQDRGRQFLASQLETLAGTRMAGFNLTRQASAGKWGKATYALQQTEGAANQGGAPTDHRDHRDHKDDEAAAAAPMTPMPPMPSEAPIESPKWSARL